MTIGAVMAVLERRLLRTLAEAAVAVDIGAAAAIVAAVAPAALDTVITINERWFEGIL